MAKYRKKPVVIEAMQFTEETKHQCFNWITCNHYADWDSEGNVAIRIETLESDHRATLGDWIIKGVKGEFYPCKPDIFALTYEAADAASDPQAAALASALELAEHKIDQYLQGQYQDGVSLGNTLKAIRTALAAYRAQERTAGR